MAGVAVFVGHAGDGVTGPGFPEAAGARIQPPTARANTCRAGW